MWRLLVKSDEKLLNRSSTKIRQSVVLHKYNLLLNASTLPSIFVFNIRRAILVSWSINTFEVLHTLSYLHKVLGAELRRIRIYEASCEEAGVISSFDFSFRFEIEQAVHIFTYH